MPDARCQDSEISAAVPRPRIREHFMRQNPSVGVAACKADPAGIQGVVAALAWEKLPTLALRGRSRKREAPAQDYSKLISSSIYTVIGHLQQEGSDQGLCGCSCCTILYATCTTFWVVVAMSK